MKSQQDRPPAVRLLLSRLPVLLAIALAALVLAASVQRTGTVRDGWSQLGANTLPFTFADLRFVTQSIDCIDRGFDPYVEVRCDPLGHGYNYPPIWLKMRLVGISLPQTDAIGWTLVALLTCSLLLIFEAKSISSGVMIVLACLSPPVTWAMERGNIDIVIFFLVVLCLVLIGTLRTTWQNFLTGALITFVAILKIYPVAMVVLFARNRRGYLLAIATGIFGVLAAMICAWPHFFQFLANTPQTGFLSFGSLPFFSIMARIFAPSQVDAFTTKPTLDSIGAIILGVLSIALGWRCRTQLFRLVPRLDYTTVSGRLALSGLAIFSICWLRGSNYNYRLIFLLLPLALIFKGLDLTRSRLALLFPLLVFGLFWGPPGLRLRLYVTQPLDGLVYVMVSAWLGVTMLERALSSRSELADSPAARSSPSC